MNYRNFMSPPTMNPAEEKLHLLRSWFSKQADVSLSLSRHVCLKAAKDSKNLVFSPLSLNVVVGLFAAAASGSTLAELLSYLKSDSINDVIRLSSELVSVILSDGSPSGGPKLSVANSIWIQKGLPLKLSFKHVLQDSFKADSFHVDFRTDGDEIVSMVNLWGEKQTNGLIKGVLPRDSVDEFTRVILANALYFKGEWLIKFSPWRTKEHDFHLLGGDSVKAPFMSSYETQFVEVFDGFKVLGLPYTKGRDGRQFSMYIFLPDSVDGLPALVDKVGSEPGFVGRHLPRSRVGLKNYRVPKFKFSFGFEASESLKSMGAHLVFKHGLTEMVDSSEDPFVSNIFHKAFIEVNELGTEAAAVTVGTSPGYSPPTIDFVADHPFLFLIQEDTTGVVLFFGHVLNPLIQE